MSTSPPALSTEVEREPKNDKAPSKGLLGIFHPLRLEGERASLTRRMGVGVGAGSDA
jgi:hypothetical protein